MRMTTIGDLAKSDHEPLANSGDNGEAEDGDLLQMLDAVDSAIETVTTGLRGLRGKVAGRMSDDQKREHQALGLELSKLTTLRGEVKKRQRAVAQSAASASLAKSGGVVAELTAQLAEMRKMQKAVTSGQVRFDSAAQEAIVRRKLSASMSATETALRAALR